ncbi:unnamed protein product [Callosobruchus maculatus]|uniref:Protein sleepless n=1 Tax=Callosobruchus maculatus TaxID=64391 RepID=A0A653BPG9_CALMS|nr:unnamed protein product [Callosobruchus maculatus]
MVHTRIFLFLAASIALVATSVDSLERYSCYSISNTNKECLDPLNKEKVPTVNCNDIGISNTDHVCAKIVVKMNGNLSVVRSCFSADVPCADIAPSGSTLVECKMCKTDFCNGQ